MPPHALFLSSPPLPLRTPLLPHLPRTSRHRTPSIPLHSKPCHLPMRAEQANETPQETTLIPEVEALDPESGSVIVPPTFNLAGAFLFTGGWCVYQGNFFLLPGLPVLLIGALLAVQTLRVRFIFGPTRLSVAKRTSDGLSIIRGWRYDGITNWEFWWKQVPVLVYFKENESYAGRGSIHFFPILFNGSQLLDQLIKNTPHLDKSRYL